jgi:LPXTG-motif cell wall-anchored protein
MSTTAPIATASATGQPDENNARNTGIGAGVGAGVGLLILIAGIIFFVRRHKRKNREIGGSSGSEFCGTESNKQPVEIWTQPAEMWTQPAEMWTQPQELPTKAQPVWEMSGNPHTPRIV